MRSLTRMAVCALTLAAGVGAASLPVPASAAPRSPEPPGLHDTMMPPDSPDARSTAGAPSSAVPHVSTGATPQLSGATPQLQAVSAPLPTGVDVSHHQDDVAPINWTQVAASGQKFAITKAIEAYTDSASGQTKIFTDPYLASHLADAHAAGLVVSAYDFARPQYPALMQADAFASAIGTLPAGSLPPVLDLEDDGGLSVPQLVAWTHAFLDELEVRTGVLPMIYSGPNFWATAMGGSTEFTRYPLWEAHYTTAAAPSPMGGWSSYTLWQFTDGNPDPAHGAGAPVPGISGYVDQDRFNAATGATLSNLHLPNGSFDAAAADGTGLVSARGWTIDPDTPATSTTVEVSVDGVLQTVTANGYRSDIAGAYPLAGSAHGFAATAHTGPGDHTVCVNAVDTSGSGQRRSLGCRTVTVTPRYPTGSFESLVADGTGKLTLRGWTIDPDTPTTAVRVTVFLDGHAVLGTTANLSRPDIGTRYPSAGNLHGFAATTKTSLGAHTVCVYVVDTSFPSRIPRLACRSVTVTPNYPFGSFESAQVDGTGKLTVRGWTIDPDTPTTAVRVNVFVDGHGVVGTMAKLYRPDVAAVYPKAGSLHGFSASAQVTAGAHTVCVYAVDTTFPSRIPRLGCRTVG